MTGPARENILYSFRRCPYAMRARWAIIRTGQVVTLREVNLKEKPKEMLEISSKGTVPILLTKDQEVIDESLEIMTWSLKKDSDQLNIIRENDKKSREIINQLLKQNDDVFKLHLDKFKYACRYPGEDPDCHKESARRILYEWNLRLKGKSSPSSNWLVGNNESLADWGIWPFVRQYMHTDSKWINENHEMEPIREWLNKFTRSNLFEILMLKQKPWSKTHKPISFPRYSTTSSSKNIAITWPKIEST
ncbi:glutathione S-transferase N-terminal domain-containing protein [Prochlorococcus sp. MIT 1341]|uniref:glutathione S-transferase N-terminal domain-containing protein n=1 Tax=Prochlorococcus sp. MIT 1341 TaxID=3096221 RepID=UPI002A74F2D0|nr:glutathione S-transferase N-terminal domain-containing protein [Prochlorococcus sp. MIT 1341]